MRAWVEQLHLVFYRGARPLAPPHAGCTCALEAAALNTLTTGVELPAGAYLIVPEREFGRKES